IGQLTRNRSGLDISGRDHIWAFYVQFISDNILFGNGGYKIYFQGKMHAHNSYLQLLATNGMVIFLLYLTLILKNIGRQNLFVVITLMVYSTAQYGIFWGISIMDIALFYFLFRQTGIADDFKL